MKFDDIEIEDVDFEAMLEESFKKSESKSDLVAGTVVKIDEKDEIAVIDIGGGSSEVIIGNKKGILYKKSLQIGAVRLTERYFKKWCFLPLKHHF